MLKSGSRRDFSRKSVTNATTASAAITVKPVRKLRSMGPLLEKNDIAAPVTDIATTTPKENVSKLRRKISTPFRRGRSAKNMQSSESTVSDAQVSEIAIATSPVGAQTASAEIVIDPSFLLSFTTAVLASIDVAQVDTSVAVPAKPASFDELLANENMPLQQTDNLEQHTVDAVDAPVKPKKRRERKTMLVGQVVQPWINQKSTANVKDENENNAFAMTTLCVPPIPTDKSILAQVNDADCMHSSNNNNNNIHKDDADRMRSNSNMDVDYNRPNNSDVDCMRFNYSTDVDAAVCMCSNNNTGVDDADCMRCNYNNITDMDAEDCMVSNNNSNNANVNDEVFLHTYSRNNTDVNRREFMRSINNNNNTGITMNVVDGEDLPVFLESPNIEIAAFYEQPDDNEFVASLQEPHNIGTALSFEESDDVAVAASFAEQDDIAVAASFAGPDDMVVAEPDDIVVAAESEVLSQNSNTSKSVYNIQSDDEFAISTLLTGDLFWGQIYNYCFWPCVVCPDPETKNLTRHCIERKQNHTMVHVRFLSDAGRRSWIKADKLLPYRGYEHYMSRLDFSDKKRLTLFLPPDNRKYNWHAAILEAHLMQPLAHSDRMSKFEKFCERNKLFPKTKKPSKQTNENTTQKRRRSVESDQASTASAPTGSGREKRRRLERGTANQTEAHKTAEADKKMVEVNKKNKSKRTAEYRPMDEVVDDILNLDSKHLFDGKTRQFVCKYCLKATGKVEKCAKGCGAWFHTQCTTESSAEIMYPITEVQSTVRLTPAICQDCAKGEKPKCGVCHEFVSPHNTDEKIVNCNRMHCRNSYHPSCLRVWPQARLSYKKQEQSLLCPVHVCHTCVSSNPKEMYHQASSTSLIKCVKCPATYHLDSACIPAGSEILTAACLICPRHADTKGRDNNVNTNWCFSCTNGGVLICCDSCPIAVHEECLNRTIQPSERYICEGCETGRLPLYGEIVWTKQGNFRWWPAIIIPPCQVPLNLMKSKHKSSDFVVRFFGTSNLHAWMSRRRVYLFEAGDGPDKCYKNRTHTVADASYLKALEEAKEVHAKVQQHQQQRKSDYKLVNRPTPYQAIKTNQYVAPLKCINEDTNTCVCDPNSENPCGPESACLNRAINFECSKNCPAGERCQNRLFDKRIYPKLEVSDMKERGFGVICLEDIEKDRFIIEYVGEVINEKEFKQRLQQMDDVCDHNHYFLQLENDRYIDAGPKGNFSRFLNHSCEPNCETRKWSVNGNTRIGIFALTDIPAGTELTFDYEWSATVGAVAKTCLCGSTKCTGVIGGKAQTVSTKSRKSVSAKMKQKKNSDTNDDASSLLSAKKGKTNALIKTELEENRRQFCDSPSTSLSSFTSSMSTMSRTSKSALKPELAVTPTDSSRKYRRLSLNISKSAKTSKAVASMTAQTVSATTSSTLAFCQEPSVPTMTTQLAVITPTAVETDTNKKYRSLSSKTTKSTKTCTAVASMATPTQAVASEPTMTTQLAVISPKVVQTDSNKKYRRLSSKTNKSTKTCTAVASMATPTHADSSEPTKTPQLAVSSTAVETNSSKKYLRLPLKSTATPKSNTLKKTLRSSLINNNKSGSEAVAPESNSYD